MQGSVVAGVDVDVVVDNVGGVDVDVDRALGADVDVDNVVGADVDTMTPGAAKLVPDESVLPSARAADTVSQLLDVAADMTRLIGAVEAARAQVIDAAIRASVRTVSGAGSSGSRELRLRSLRAELACLLRLPEGSAERMLVTSELLTRALPDTLAAVGDGRISYRHAEVLVDEVVSLDLEVAADVEVTALPHAETMTVARFRRKLRMLREEAQPGSAIERHREAAKCREVVFEPARDGMAWLSAYLPAPDALAAFTRLTDAAEAMRCNEAAAGGRHGSDAGESDEQTVARTLAQLRADVFTDLLLNGEPATCGAPTGIRPTVHVTVPVLTLLTGPDTEGATFEGERAVLDGYGPIDDVTARRLAAHAPSFVRLLTHPESGAVLSVGRDRYAVPSDLRRWLRVRDGTCRFPQCSQPVRRCDIDHTHDWAHGGVTAHDNLAHLCRGHHRLKHAAGWRARNDGGRITWTSPQGRNYTTEPETVLRV